MELCFWAVKLVTVVSIHKLKITVRSSYLNKENLARGLKSQKLRSEKTIIMERLML